VKVAVAIISNVKGELLVTQRSPDQTHGGYWEFPGGKVEVGETPEAALIREIKEEVDLLIHQSIFLGRVNHCYSDKTVDLYVYKVTDYSGKACCLENQLAMQWVRQDALAHLSFPKANHRIIELFLNASELTNRKIHLDG